MTGPLNVCSNFDLSVSLYKINATSSDAYGATFPSRGRLICNTVLSIKVKLTVIFETNNLI